MRREGREGGWKGREEEAKVVGGKITEGWRQAGREEMGRRYLRRDNKGKGREEEEEGKKGDRDMEMKGGMEIKEGRGRKGGVS